MKRNTIQKKLVLEVVNTLKTHPTADEIYEHISALHPTISKGTVYRNLNNLCEDGEVYRVRVPNSSDRFDCTIHKHYHMVCQSCKKVFDVELDYMEDLISQIADKNGFEVKDYELIFSGICKNCKENQINNI